MVVHAEWSGELNWQALVPTAKKDVRCDEPQTSRACKSKITQED
jgi:hypothetical protein